MDWTDEMDEKISSGLGQLKQLATELGVTVHQIYHRRGVLIAAGALESARRRWTWEEDALVAGDTPAVYLAAQLGRSEMSVSKRRCYLRRRRRHARVAP